MKDNEENQKKNKTSSFKSAAKVLTMIKTV